MTELPGDDAAFAATPGATLAAAREANGLSIIEVAEQMRISPRQVEAIEADRYGDLPGAVFVRGFVRNYARLLRLDPVPLLHALEPALGGDVPLRAHEIAGTLPEANRRSHGRFWWAVIAIVILLAALAALYEWWRARSGAEDVVAPGADVLAPATPQAPAPATPPTHDAVPLAPQRLPDTPPGQGTTPMSPAPGAGGISSAPGATGTSPAPGGASSPAGGSGMPPAPGATSSAPRSGGTSFVPGGSAGASPASGAAGTPFESGALSTTPQAGAPASSTGAASSGLPATGEPPSAAAAAASATGNGRIQIEATADSWLEVRDGAGTVQFSATIPAGATRSVEAKPPLQVVVGNASGVRITYNDRPVDVASHATRNIARFRLE